MYGMVLPVITCVCFNLPTRTMLPYLDKMMGGGVSGEVSDHVFHLYQLSLHWKHWKQIENIAGKD